MMSTPLRFMPLSAAVMLLAITSPLAGLAQATPPPAPRAAPMPTPAPLSAPAPMAAPAPPAAPRPPRAPRLSGGYLGVELVDLTPELREHFGAAREAGVMVGRVEPGSPAARAGLAVGDIVTRIGADPVHDSWGFSGEVSSREGGEALEMSVVRDRQERKLVATLERREREGVDVGRWIFPPMPAVPGPPPVASAPAAPAMPPVGPALERLGRLLESDEFQEQIRAYQTRIDGEVEKRMKELEGRLKELERRLQEGDRR
jgi:hypothetical protein